jgi:hypothetical protein
MQVVEKMANFDGIRSTYHTFSYLIYLHMALDQCQWFGYDQGRSQAPGNTGHGLGRGNKFVR